MGPCPEQPVQLLPPVLVIPQSEELSLTFRDLSLFDLSGVTGRGLWEASPLGLFKGKGIEQPEQLGVDKRRLGRG